MRVLARMERVGIEVDEARLTGLRDKLASDAGKLRGVVIEAAGAEINVNSPKQISALLFDTLGLTPQKKTKSGAFSTDAGTLEKLRAEHSVVGALLDYREVEKLRSTYGEGLLAAVRLETDNRIRATFKQTVARTGRLSSDAPNLHNIPVRTEAGREFRQVFRSREGCLLLVADYNQIELRVHCASGRATRASSVPSRRATTSTARLAASRSSPSTPSRGGTRSSGRWQRW